MYTELQKTQNCQSNSEEKEQSWRHNPPRLQISATKLQEANPCGVGVEADTEIHLTEESPEINPHTYGQLIHDRGGKTTQQREDSLPNKRCWASCVATCERMELERSLSDGIQAARRPLLRGLPQPEHRQGARGAGFPNCGRRSAAPKSDSPAARQSVLP